jgi:hypothetical protein
LIRHVGVCLAAAVFLDLGLRRRWQAFWAALSTAGALVFPWVLWLASVGHDTQIGLLADKSLAGRVSGQAIFYLQRLPDQITGPLVEVATVFGRSSTIAGLANLWAVAATGVIILGWFSTLRTPRRRLAGLVGSITLALLIIWPFTEAGRLLFPIIPFLLVGASEGLARIMAIAGLRRPRNWACGIVLAASIPYAAYALATGRAEAQRLTHADFDAACQWITQNATRPGPVLTRHPGEVFWQTGRQAVAPVPPDPEGIDQLINRFAVAYLLIDEDRYANETSNPLSVYVKQYSGRVALKWGGNQRADSIQLFEVKGL